MDYKVAAVIVTYNRKELLINCLDAISKQSYKPSKVFIIDNASTDGTESLVEKSGYKDSNSECKHVNGLDYVYIKLSENTGGAGGFYTGMKLAHETGLFDAVWVMDDDGVPCEECLEYLCLHLDKYDYIAPTVVSIEDKKSLAFPYDGVNLSYSEFKAKAENDIIANYACPMNGILYSKKLINQVGYPNPNMFIWGDEQNLNRRCIAHGFLPVTDVRAVHFHPISKDVYANSIFGTKIVYVPQLWKGYCQYRNTIYNYHDRMSLGGLLKYYMIHMYYFTFKIHSLRWMKCFNDAFFSGFKEKLDKGYLKYMK